ncbi:MAG: biopolymer transporter ExbD [Myxococcales bacterium]
MKAVMPKTRPMLDAGGVSATDIIMNLFVFFFIAFSLLATFNKNKHDAQNEEEQQRERQQQILLPASQREAPVVAGDAIMVELDLEQRARVDGKPLSGQSVTDAVKAALGPHRKNVVVRAHKDLSLGATVTLMDQVWAAGPESVAIATLPGLAPP